MAVRYQIKNFAPFGLFINYLCHRLKENNDTFNYTNYAFMWMAQSILDSIPKRNGDGVEQPLIILELNLLESYRQIGEESRFVNAMIELASYSASLLSEGHDLAVIYNNASIASHMIGDEDRAVIEISISRLSSLDVSFRLFLAYPSKESEIGIGEILGSRHF